MSQRLELTEPRPQDDAIQEMLLLAERLRAQTGGELDDAAILAVAEATGAPESYVRLAIGTMQPRRKRTLVERGRAWYLSVNPSVRHTVGGLILGASAGLLMALNQVAGTLRSGLPILDGLIWVLALVGVVNAASSSKVQAGAYAGGAWGGSFVLCAMLIQSLVTLLTPFEVGGLSGFFLALAMLLGAAIGGVAQQVYAANRSRLGHKDAVRERQELLHQLLEIQSRLSSDEKQVTFLSVDIVGSTRMKQGADPLLVEFTFNEYHRYVEGVVGRHGGRVHSTAGDGVTCYFEDPQAAFLAGRALLSGLFEFNAFRNKLAQTIELRAGVHTGSVLAPGQDVGSVNFASVIDLAAHLQKAAPIGGLALSEEVAFALPGQGSAHGFEPTVVSDMRALVWKPAHRVRPETLRALKN